MSIIIPGVRNKDRATTADIIVEQIALCKANLESIERIAKFRIAREMRDEINRRLRSCHDFLGMGGSRKKGCLYREVGHSEKENLVCEHAIPVTALVSLYQKGVPFEQLVFYPVSLISKESDKRFESLGLVKSGHSEEIPFLRYYKADIQIETHHGAKIECNKWSMDDHWKLIEQTAELNSIKNEVDQKLN